METESRKTLEYYNHSHLTNHPFTTALSAFSTLGIGKWVPGKWVPMPGKQNLDKTNWVEV